MSAPELLDSVFIFAGPNPWFYRTRGDACGYRDIEVQRDADRGYTIAGERGPVTEYRRVDPERERLRDAVIEAAQRQERGLEETSYARRNAIDELDAYEAKEKNG